MSNYIIKETFRRMVIGEGKLTVYTTHKVEIKDLSFNVAIKYLNIGYKIRRATWDDSENNFISLTEDNRIVWHDGFFFDEAFFEYRDVIATDWMAVKK